MLNVANLLKDCGGNYFFIMTQKMTVICFIIFSCSSLPNPSADKKNAFKNDLNAHQNKFTNLPPTKTLRPDLIRETIFSRGYLTGYDIWEYLREKPDQNDIIEIFGLPDSVWLDDRKSTKFLYYFISEMQDYNTIEISTQSDSVSGFEWD
tara:strand:- start:1180 stop:1629 length:450 start_codon:yes stop_codon:yes gene_type:complete